MVDDTERKSPLDEMDELIEEQKKDLRDNESEEPEATSEPHAEEGTEQGNDDTPEDPEYDYDDSYDSGGVSSAYDLDAMGRPDKSAKAPKSNTGAAKAPERKKSGYKPESSKDFLQVCYNEIIMAAYAGAINFATDLVLDLADWILFAPFSGFTSAEKKSDKGKEKTIYDYADDIIAENNMKGQKLARGFLERHKEIMDNIEKQKNGQAPEWHIWKQEPTCFANLVEISAKAEADANSPEAKQWEEFKSLPQRALSAISNQITMLNFAVHHQAIVTQMSDVDPLPVELTKAFKNMGNILEDAHLDDATVKNKLNAEITEARRHTTAGTPVNAEINGKIDELAQLLSNPSCTREAIAEKIVDLQRIHPIKHKLKEDAAHLYEEMRTNLRKIKAAYAQNPDQAREEMEKYFQRISATQEKAKKEKDKDEDASWIQKNIGVNFSVFGKQVQYGKTKERAQHAVNVAQNTINEINVPQNQGRNPQSETSHRSRLITDNQDIERLINFVGRKR